MSRALSTVVLVMLLAWLAVRSSPAHAETVNPAEAACVDHESGEACRDDEHHCVHSSCRRGSNEYPCLVCDAGAPSEVIAPARDHTLAFALIGGAAAAVLFAAAWAIVRRRAKPAA